ncbi:VanZ family protein [Bacillus testis]|uniref:VanZ family protein n=1 Tax=Bacillus testis TaxID=1622072 RepID=UPI00067F101D|nr:VanZ family protein [Bacillus testis]
MKKTITCFLWLLPFIYMAVIWALSSIPSNALVELPDSKWDHYWKESMHLIEFAILYALLAIALAASGKLTASTSLAAAIVAMVYGVLDEYHQSFYPYRSATVIDVIKDWIGVIAVWAHVRYHYFNRKKSLLNTLERTLHEQ